MSFNFIWQILSFYQTDLLPSESIAELFDVAGKSYTILKLGHTQQMLKSANMPATWGDYKV